jgi:hypothetical protein
LKKERLEEEEEAEGGEAVSNAPEFQFEIEGAEVSSAADQTKTGKRDASVDLESDEEESFDEDVEETGEEAGFGILQLAFQPYFAEWQSVYARPKRESKSGTYIFHVCLGGRRQDRGVWRRLAMPATRSLDALAETILAAFKFNRDHPYDFCYRDQRGRKRIYNHPFTDEGPVTLDITVGESDLAIKDEMLFTFDYGDNWEFKVRLESIDTSPSKVRRAKVIESVGKAPEQYPKFEE